jgi:hypothetical protein
MTKTENMRLTQSSSSTVTATKREMRRYGTSTPFAHLPTVRFETQDGRTVETDLSMWPWELPNYRLFGNESSLIEVGDEVAVIYTPSFLLRPGEYARLSPDDRLPLAWPLSCLKIVGISLVVLIFSILMISPLIGPLAAVLLSYSVFRQH